MDLDEGQIAGTIGSDIIWRSLLVVYNDLEIRKDSTGEVFHDTRYDIRFTILETTFSSKSIRYEFFSQDFFHTVSPGKTFCDEGICSGFKIRNAAGDHPDIEHPEKIAAGSQNLAARDNLILKFHRTGRNVCTNSILEFWNPVLEGSPHPAV